MTDAQPQAEPPVTADADPLVVPVTEETVAVHTREVERARWRIERRVETHRAEVPTVLRTAEVVVERRRVDRWLADDETPAVRAEGDTLIAPVVEEVPVVQLRRRLAEEVVVRRQVHEVPATQPVELRRDHVSVDRIATADAAASAAGDSFNARATGEPKP